MGLRGPKPLTTEERARRGTVRPDRERKYAAQGDVEAPAVEVQEFLAEGRDYVGIAARYMADVLAGRIVACRWVKLAVERQARDLARTDEAWSFGWSPYFAARACRFVESCPHVEGRWSKPLIVLEPFQVFLVAALFGWRRREDATRRRFTLLYFEVARKSAKSTLAAALALLHLADEDETGASVICGATTGLQARMVFGVMQKMVRRSAWLAGRGLVAYANAIVGKDGTAKPVNSKASTLDGLNPSCIVLDESHAQDFGLHDVLKSAQGARRNPLMLCPTTAGYDLLSVGYTLRGQLAKVLEGVYEADHLLGAIYTLDEDDDWRDARAWIKASPMLGITPTLDYVKAYCQDAQQAKELEGEFKVKICNVWGSSSLAWLKMGHWDKCADPALRLEDFAGRPCWIASDLASLDDLAATALVFKDDQERLVGFVRAYLPEGVVEERARTVPAYRGWAEAGLMVLTEGAMIDYARIEKDLRADCARFQVRQLVFDQYGSIQIAGALAADGLPAVVEPKSARTFTPPMRELEARLKSGKFRHDGNSLLKWAASNVHVTRRVDGSLLAKKEHQDSANKIDPVDALIQAIGATIRSQAARPKEYQLLVIGGGRDGRTDGTGAAARPQPPAV